jgi:hypothetical protein
MRWMRGLAGLLALAMAANGLQMLMAPEAWYGSLPSVAHTGPLNVHFVRDIGAAYLASAAGVGLGVWRSAWLVPGGGTALVFLGLHAGLHLLEWGHGHAASAHAGWIDNIGVYGPAVLLLVWMFLGRREAHHV